MLSGCYLSGVRGRNTIEVQCVGAEVLAVLPLNAAQNRPYRVEESLVVQLPEDAQIQVRFDVKHPDFTVGERECQRVISSWTYSNDSWIHTPHDFLGSRWSSSAPELHLHLGSLRLAACRQRRIRVGDQAPVGERDQPAQTERDRSRQGTQAKAATGTARSCAQERRCSLMRSISCSVPAVR